MLTLQIVLQSSRISPYIREGSGLKRRFHYTWKLRKSISPYIRGGSGLKPTHGLLGARWRAISPYIREGSGLKLII